MVFKQRNSQGSLDIQTSAKFDLSSSGKILGVTFDSTLKWDIHID